jgi:hypothetical protein
VSKKVEMNFDEVNEKLFKGAQNGVTEFCTIVAKESSKQAPFDKGALRKSLQVEVLGLSGIVSYGGVVNVGESVDTSEYATIMHEGIINGKPVKYQRGKKKKYLEDPFKKESGNFVDILAKNIKI